MKMLLMNVYIPMANYSQLVVDADFSIMSE